MKQPELFEVDLGNRKVHIIKVQRISAQGRHKHTNKEGLNLHKTQSGRAGTRWSIPDIDTMLNTGLWKMRKNPYYIPSDKEDTEGHEMKVLPSTTWKEMGVDRKKYISWQEYFEISHYKTPGYYSSERVQWNRIAADRKYKNTALQSFRFFLIDGTNILDLSKPKDQLMYFFALQCKQSFLKDKKDKKKFPRAMFYIQEINAPAQEEYNSNVELDEAIVNLVKLRDKQTPEDLRKFSVILKVGTYQQSVEKHYNHLRSFILGDIEIGNSKTNATRFNELYKILTRKGGKIRFQAMFDVQEMLNSRVITKDGMKFIWISKKGTDDELLGKSLTEVVSKLLDADQAHLRQMLLKELENKTFK